eukprot:SAG31_NODE_480_length_15108_cov_56.073423_7_plen_39_part_00
MMPWQIRRNLRAYDPDVHVCVIQVIILFGRHVLFGRQH